MKAESNTCADSQYLWVDVAEDGRTDETGETPSIVRALIAIPPAISTREAVLPALCSAVAYAPNEYGRLPTEYDNDGRLMTDFERLSLTEEDILAFVEEHGVLGADRTARFREIRQPGHLVYPSALSGDTLDDWRRAQEYYAAFRRLSYAHIMNNTRFLKKVIDVTRTYRSYVNTLHTDPSYAFNPAHEEYLLTFQLPDSSTAYTFFVSHHETFTRHRHQYPYLAQRILQEMMNRQLAAHTHTVFIWSSDDKRKMLIPVPSSLLGAIWLQEAHNRLIRRSFERRQRLVYCVDCSAPMQVTRSDAKRCKRCKEAAKFQRRQARKASRLPVT